MAARLLTASLFFLLCISAGALGQAAKPKTPVKPGPAPAMVGIVTGDVDSTGTRAASDLARVLDDGVTLRIVPIIGKSSMQNINDLLGMKVVDVAIVQSDVLTYFQKQNPQPGVQQRIQYISKLYSEEVHILARMQMTCLADLTKRRVSIGPKDSGSAITAAAIFDANGIKVEELNLDHEDAIDKLKKGEIDALVYIGGKPSRAFDRITYKDKVHFLDIDYAPSLQANYLPAIMTSEDYPSLVAPNESVATIGVSSVMAVHNFPAQSERFRAMSRFAERFLAEFDRLKSGPYSQKWREVNIQAPVKGWQRFLPAERWLVSNAKTKVAVVPQEAAQRLKTMLQQFVESQRGSSADQEELFNQFVRWYQTQGLQR